MDMKTLTDIEVYMVARMLGARSTNSLFNDINKSPYVHMSFEDCDNHAHFKFKHELSKRGIDYKTGMKTVTQPTITSILRNT
jgi:hypothetical protein